MTPSRNRPGRTSVVRSDDLVHHPPPPRCPGPSASRPAQGPSPKRNSSACGFSIHAHRCRASGPVNRATAAQRARLATLSRPIKAPHSVVGGRWRWPLFTMGRCGAGGVGAILPPRRPPVRGCRSAGLPGDDQWWPLPSRPFSRLVDRSRRAGRCAPAAGRRHPAGPRNVPGAHFLRLGFRARWAFAGWPIGPPGRRGCDRRRPPGQPPRSGTAGPRHRAGGRAPDRAPRDPDACPPARPTRRRTGRSGSGS